MIHIAIDAGHGGHNKGTHRGALVEKDLTLAIAKVVVGVLEKSKHVHPHLIRTHDTPLSLRARSRIAKRAGCVSAVIIHANWASDPHRSGGEIYTHQTDIIGETLGACIVDAIPREARFWKADSRTRNAVNIVTSYINADIPCALFEVGFLSNDSDYEWLMDIETVPTIGAQTAHGIDTWARSFQK